MSHQPVVQKGTEQRGKIPFPVPLEVHGAKPHTLGCGQQESAQSLPCQCCGNSELR